MRATERGPLGPRRGLADFIRSSRLALFLLVAAAALILPGTLAPVGSVEAFVRLHLGAWALAPAHFLGVVDPQGSPVFGALIGTLALNVSLCTWHRVSRRWRAGGPGARVRPALDAAMHLSLLVIIAGALAKGAWGYVRTQSVAVGGSTTAFYDFDVAAEMPLGFSLVVLERQDSYYPLSVRVGVDDRTTRGKIALLELSEGGEAVLAGGGLRLDRVGPGETADRLRVRVAAGTQEQVLEFETAPERPHRKEVGPFGLTLVAWRRDLRSVRARVSCEGAGGIPTTGWVSPQERLECRGVHFALTAWGTDAEGNRFVGLQAVREPGAPLFWAGCVLLSLSLPLFLATRRGGSSRDEGGSGAAGRDGERGA